MIKLSERLRELRKENKITQVKVSKDLGIAQATYSGYETGLNEPSAEMLMHLSDYFNVSVDYLLGKSDIKATQAEEDFMKAVEVNSIDEMIHKYNITLGEDEKMDTSEEKKLVKLIKMFIEKE